MNGFKQYIEGLSSHGGFPFTAKTGNADAWEYGDSRQQKDLINLYRNSIKKMEEKLVKFPNHNFHIYYGVPNNELLKSIATDGISSSVDVKLQQKDALDRLFFVDMGIPKTDIVFLKAQHSGDPLTAWMTFHTLAHGLVDSAEERVIFNDLGISLLYNLVNKLFKNGNSDAKKYFSKDGMSGIHDTFLLRTDKLHSDYMKYDNDEDKKRIANIIKDRGKIDEVFGCIYPFRSARMDRNNPGIIKFGGVSEERFARVDDKGELTYELMASYLWYGGDIPRPKGDCLQKIAKFFGLDEQDILNIIDRKFNEIEVKMKKLLDSAAGKVIVD
jgi:hypothetical protein